MINLSDFNLESLFEEVDKIFETYVKDHMPVECYGWRSWMIELALSKHSNGQLEKLHNQKGRDLRDIDSMYYEFKQVKDAFKDNTTPSIILKNFRGKCLGLSEKTFDFLIIMDVDRKMLGMYDWDYVNRLSKLNDATVTVKLELSNVIETVCLPNSLSNLLEEEQKPKYEIVEYYQLMLDV
tara:strand:- start:49 stop:591 length:543 start_codon:yes stop_codon:yes gene_type:complete